MRHSQPSSVQHSSAACKTGGMASSARWGKSARLRAWVHCLCGCTHGSLQHHAVLLPVQAFHLQPELSAQLISPPPEGCMLSVLAKADAQPSLKLLAQPVFQKQQQCTLEEQGGGSDHGCSPAMDA